MADWGMKETMAKIRDLPMPDEDMPVNPMGDDMHRHINDISEIDSKIRQLQIQRAKMTEAFQLKLEEIAKHFSDVIHGPTESDGGY